METRTSRLNAFETAVKEASKETGSDKKVASDRAYKLAEQFVIHEDARQPSANALEKPTELAKGIDTVGEILDRRILAGGKGLLKRQAVLREMQKNENAVLLGNHEQVQKNLETILREPDDPAVNTPAHHYKPLKFYKTTLPHRTFTPTDIKDLGTALSALKQRVNDLSGIGVDKRQVEHNNEEAPRMKRSRIVPSMAATTSAHQVDWAQVSHVSDTSESGAVTSGDYPAEDAQGGSSKIKLSRLFEQDVELLPGKSGRLLPVFDPETFHEIFTNTAPEAWDADDVHADVTYVSQGERTYEFSDVSNPVLSEQLSEAFGSPPVMLSDASGNTVAYIDQDSFREFLNAIPTKAADANLLPEDVPDGQLQERNRDANGHML